MECCTFRSFQWVWKCNTDEEGGGDGLNNKRQADSNFCAVLSKGDSVSFYLFGYKPRNLK